MDRSIFGYVAMIAFLCGLLAAEETFTAESPRWMNPDFPSPRIVKGSALDLTYLAEPGPAGEFGRAVIGKNGSLEFRNRPGVAVRLNGGSVPWWEPRKAENLHRHMKVHVEDMRRQGYNFTRLSIDRSLFVGTAEDQKPVHSALDNFGYVLKICRDNGIYSMLTLGSYYLGYKEDRFKERNNIKLKMLLGDPEIRSAWRRVAECVLNFVNPHTGVAVKEDPSIVFVEFFNELDLAEYQLGDRKNTADEVRRIADRKFREFLRKRYASIDALNREWKRKYARFDEIVLAGGKIPSSIVSAFWLDRARDCPVQLEQGSEQLLCAGEGEGGDCDCQQLSCASEGMVRGRRTGETDERRRGSRTVLGGFRDDASAGSSAGCDRAESLFLEPVSI